MSPSHSPNRSVWSALLRLLVAAIGFVVIVAILIGVVLATGDPESPFLTTIILTPFVLALIGVLIAEQRKR